MDNLNGHFRVLSLNSVFPIYPSRACWPRQRWHLFWNKPKRWKQFGNVFRSVLSGYLSDKFSRKAAVFLSQLFSGGCCLLIAIGMHYEHSPFKSILFCLAGYTLRKNKQDIRYYGSLHNGYYCRERERQTYISSERRCWLCVCLWTCGGRVFFRRRCKKNGYFYTAVLSASSVQFWPTLIWCLPQRPHQIARSLGKRSKV